MTPVKVLIVDDSAVVRDILTQGLAADPDIRVVGTAGDAYRARDLILRHEPDVVTLDVEMPRMDGVTFLRKLMPQYPIPVIMVSSLTGPGASATLEALQWGAVEIVQKPSGQLRTTLPAMMEDLRLKVKAAALVDVSRWQRVGDTSHPVPEHALAQSTKKIIAVGASTGGTVAIRSVLTALPADMAGMVIVQHMPPVFTRLFSERLNEECRVQVKEAEDGDSILQGRVLIAPGGRQTRVSRSGGEYRVKVSDEARVNGHCPSVDVLFDSVAKAAGSNSVGLLMTGMGRDGAEGLLAMRRAGARTLSQDEASSVIYGMPLEAWKRGASERQVSLTQIPAELVALIKGMP